MYGPEGLWAELLSRSEGFIASVLERRSKRQYQLFDYWISHRHFEDFRELHHGDCQRLAQFARDGGVVERELLLGSFYEFGGGEEDSGLVPA